MGGGATTVAPPLTRSTQGTQLSAGDTPDTCDILLVRMPHSRSRRRHVDQHERDECKHDIAKCAAGSGVSADGHTRDYSRPLSMNPPKNRRTTIDGPMWKGRRHVAPRCVTSDLSCQHDQTMMTSCPHRESRRPVAECPTRIPPHPRWTKSPRLTRPTAKSSGCCAPTD